VGIRPSRSNLLRPSTEEIARYVDAELDRSRKRRARLERFLRDDFKRVPNTSTPYAVVLGIYQIWCRENGEWFRDCELHRLLTSAGYSMVDGKIPGIKLRALTDRPVNGRDDAWWPASKTAEITGISPRLLQAMREAQDVGPRWRVRGHEFLYSVTSLRQWLVKCPRFIPSEQVDSIVDWFLSSWCVFDGDHWSRCARISGQCDEWSLQTLGLKPRGLRKELWRQIRARGCRFSYHTLADGPRARTIDGVLCLFAKKARR
jgi:hypothetical protein